MGQDLTDMCVKIQLEGAAEGSRDIDYDGAHCSTARTPVRGNLHLISWVGGTLVLRPRQSPHTRLLEHKNAIVARNSYRIRASIGAPALR